ncbi:restriction endonuclease subunit S [Psychrobacter sp. FBL11]|uniref:Restriction endonuclease subunit S n=1 Tax=Psychrobacter saeujeotis TaxID=3143436 RepID=A0ABU9XBC3_9GAMM|nr:restriction endonuclease subunit S [uncultured Psychrobacter sp.]
MVPKGWERKALDEVSNVIDCKHRTPKYVGSGIPLVSPGTIKWGAIDLESPTKRVTTEEYESLMDHCTVEYGDLVLSRNQSVGIASFVDSDKPFVLGQDTVLVKPKGSDPRFLFYNLQSIDTQKTIFKLAGGSTFSRINLGDIRKLKAIYPPLAEQQKIAKILSTWDKAISTTERLIENSTQQKKALMQQLLTGKKRLLDDEGKRFEGEWEEVKLSAVAQITMGSSPKSEAYNDVGDGLPLLQGNADIKNRKSAPRIYTSQITKECHIGDILFSVRAPVGTVAISNHHACIGRGIAAIKVKKNYSQDFLYQWLLSFETKWERYSQGSTFEAVNSNDIKSLNLSVPNPNEQQKIATVLTNADNEIELLEQQLADLQQEKKALMQVLLTGKKRVVVDGEGV